MRPGRTDRVICIRAKLAEPFLEWCRPHPHYITIERRRFQDREPVTDRHAVLTIFMIWNGVLQLSVYPIKSQAYCLLPVPELVQNLTGSYPLRFWGD